MLHSTSRLLFDSNHHSHGSIFRVLGLNKGPSRLREQGGIFGFGPFPTGSPTHHVHVKEFGKKFHCIVLSMLFRLSSCILHQIISASSIIYTFLLDTLKNMPRAYIH